MKFILPVVAVCAALVGFSHFTAPPIQAQDKKIIGNMDEAALHGVIRDYLTSNPEVIVEALENYQARERARETAGFNEKLESEREALAAGPFVGNPDGEILVVEFFDYNCGYCKRALPDLEQIVENHPDVKIIFKELPILSSSSVDAARWALAAGEQGKYWEYHQALMNFSGTKSEANLERIARDLDLDVAQIKRDADSREVRAALEENSRLARELGIRGTPAFIIEDVFAPGYMGYDNMNSVINEARKNRS